MSLKLLEIRHMRITIREDDFSDSIRLNRNPPLLHRTLGPDSRNKMLSKSIISLNSPQWHPTKILRVDPLLQLSVLGTSSDDLHRSLFIFILYRFGGVATAIALKKQLGFENFVVRSSPTLSSEGAHRLSATRYMKSLMPLVGLGE